VLPYSERRTLLETLELERPGVQLVATFDDGPALLDAIVRLDLEGVVAKRERDRYRPGERAWVKTKNRATARFVEELAGVGRRSTRPAKSAF
jgi:ATP-dependent DNA ligase